VTVLCGDDQTQWSGFFFCVNLFQFLRIRWCRVQQITGQAAGSGRVLLMTERANPTMGAANRFRIRCLNRNSEIVSQRAVGITSRQQTVTPPGNAAVSSGFCKQQANSRTLLLWRQFTKL